MCACAIYDRKGGRSLVQPEMPPRNRNGKQGECLFCCFWVAIREFPKIRGTIFGGPDNKDPAI